MKDSRYFYKRAFYVSVLKESLEANGVCETASVAYLNGNRRKPILEVTPKASKSTASNTCSTKLMSVLGDSETEFSKLRCVIRVIPVFDWPDSPFSAARLAPSRNNLRSATEDDASSPASPTYNSDVAVDGSALQTANYMERIAKRSDAFAQAALLLKTWALQRNLSSEYGLSHCLYLLSILLAYVLDGTCKGVRTIPAGTGAWQAFKAVLDMLGTSYGALILTSISSSNKLSSPYQFRNRQASCFYLR